MFVLRLEVGLDEGERVFQPVEPALLAGPYVFDDERGAGLTASGPLNAENEVAPVYSAFPWFGPRHPLPPSPSSFVGLKRK